MTGRAHSHQPFLSVFALHITVEVPPVSCHRQLMCAILKKVKGCSALPAGLPLCSAHPAGLPLWPWRSRAKLRWQFDIFLSLSFFSPPSLFLSLSPSLSSPFPSLLPPSNQHSLHMCSLPFFSLPPSHSGPLTSSLTRSTSIHHHRH